MSALEHGLIGCSPEVAEVISFIATAAGSDENVVIQGETGTGKDVVARAIHSNSNRAKGPYVAVNCAALSEGVIENELFGHEREAFTGALTQKKGKFEQASGGTLFLDEIGELRPPMQAKLLRVIENRVVDRLGGSASIPVDVRLIIATNRDLRAAVAAGDFRQDFYYRTNILSVKLPPLRQHREDIPALARHFLALSACKARRRIVGISPEADALLLNHDWPGNIRELQNAMASAVAFGKTELILAEDFRKTTLFNPVIEPPKECETLDEVVMEATQRFVLKTFDRVHGDHQQAAVILDIHRKGLNRFLDRVHLPHLKKRRGRRYGST